MNDGTMAAVAALRAQQSALEVLMSAVESSLTDVTAAIEGGADRAGEMKDMLASVESTLADVAASIESSGIAKAIESVAQAFRAINVQPSSVTVEAIMPAAAAPIIHVMPAPDQKGATWEVRQTRVHGEAVMIIKRTA